MVRSSFAILFFIRDSRIRKDGTTSIGTLPFFLALLSLIKKRIENELLTIVLSFKIRLMEVL